MHIQLILLNGEKFEHTIDTSPFIIGRSPKCDIVIPHEGMSRQHCQIEVDNGEVFVTDLGSTNGVLIDGEKIEAHKKTPYATYLTLAFGAVQSLQLRVDEPTNTSTKMFMSAPSQKPNHTAMTKTKSLPEPSKAATPIPEKLKPKAQAQSKLKSIVVNLTAIMIFAAAVWWYMESENSATDEGTAEEISDQQEL